MPRMEHARYKARCSCGQRRTEGTIEVARMRRAFLVVLLPVQVQGGDAGEALCRCGCTSSKPRAPSPRHKRSDRSARCARDSARPSDTRPPQGGTKTSARARTKPIVITWTSERASAPQKVVPVAPVSIHIRALRDQFRATTLRAAGPCSRPSTVALQSGIPSVPHAPTLVMWFSIFERCEGVLVCGNMQHAHVHARADCGRRGRRGRQRRRCRGAARAERHGRRCCARQPAWATSRR